RRQRARRRVVCVGDRRARAARRDPRRAHGDRAARGARRPPAGSRLESRDAGSGRRGCVVTRAADLARNPGRSCGRRAGLSGDCTWHHRRRGGSISSGGSMSAVDDQATYGRARLGFATQADIEEFVSVLAKYERGEMTPDQWRAFRLVRGTYGQRQAEDAQMLRVKVPQGLLTAPQLRALANIGENYSRGFGHITTRQNIQFHFVKLHDVEPALRELADVGITTREACGNSVRNITGCPHAGVSADELFDITPYAEALTRYLLRHPLSSTLPRKFKIAFEGCTVDHIATGINDLAFLARISPNGGRGFRVVAGGGTSIMVKEAEVIHEFIPTSELFRVADAMLRVFHTYGDYQHKQRNRMKFMIKTLGWQRWRNLYDDELAAIRLKGEVPTLELDTPADEPKPDAARAAAPSVGDISTRVAEGKVKGPGITPMVVPILNSRDEDYTRWRETNVRPQKQFGF